MTEGAGGLPAHRSVVSIVLAVAGVLVCACEPAGPEGRGADRRALDDGTPALAPPDSWQRIALDLTSAVTPRWSPSGEHLLVRGELGIGLFLFSRRDGDLLHAEDGYRGEALFTPEGDICRGPREDARALRLGSGGQPLEPRGGRCALISEDERFGERLYAGASGAVYHDAYAGTVTRVSSEGSVSLVTDQGAWNVAVSHEGRRIAWAQGTLSEPELTVHDPATGARSLGRGAHPAWSPSGRYLLFTRPSVAEGPSGRPVYDADLFVYDASSAEVVRLTDTPDVAEMQPAIAPNGASVAFADWQGGVVYIAAAVGLGGEGGRR